jgi:predicted dehydrogenase
MPSKRSANLPAPIPQTSASRVDIASRPLSRRRFLTTTLSTSGAALAWSAWKPRGALAADKSLGANERIRVGAIGVGNRASLLLEQLPEGAEIVALCDCNLSRAEQFKAKKHGNWPVYQDYHKLLARPDIDAVVVGTGEFQRVLPCIHALQAGKDVYAEKPLTLYVQEGRALTDAVRRYKRVLQVGSQQRSMAINRLACEFVRTGRLGKLLEVRAVNYTGPSASPDSALAEEPTPAGLDWSMWLNQAAMRPFNKRWLGWMAWRDFSGGQMTNWGAHGVDQIQWALGADSTGPVEMWPLSEGPSGRVAMRYASGVEVNFILDKGPMGGAVFIGEKGKLEINRNKVTSNPKELAVELLKTIDVADEERKWSDQTALWQARAHLQNWLDCIRSRERPVADVEIGHRSISVCHLANITRETGRRLHWDPATERFVNDSPADALLIRARRPEFELPVLG